MRQFFLETDPADPPVAGNTVSLDREERHHLATVLRGGRDTVFHLTDGRGRRYTARPGAGDDLEILTVASDPEEAAAPRLTLGCAVVKGKRFEWVLEKAVELGAHAIVPLITRRGVIEPRPGKQSRWTALLRAALKQSGRTWLPGLDEATPLVDFLADTATDFRICGAVPGEMPARPWTDLLAPAPAPVPANLTVLIGPEGGWSEDERVRMTDTGVIPVGLGPHVLRTETAAVALLTAAQALRSAWRAGAA